MAQIRSTSTTTETEELKASIAYKVQAVYEYSKVLHARIQYNICPTENDMDVHVPSLDITLLRAIYCIQTKRHFPNLDLSFSTEYFPTELICLTINAIQYKGINPEEQDIG